MKFADWGPQDDPVYLRLVLMVSNTLVDVHLLTDDSPAISAMQITEEDKKGLVYVLHGVSYEESEFTDAIMALLGQRAPAVYWWLVAMEPDEDNPEPSVNVIGVYNADMPAQAITVIT